MTQPVLTGAPGPQGMPSANHATNSAVQVMRIHIVYGIISAINFKLDIKKVPDPEGGERAVITLDGKYLPTKPF